MLSPELTQVVVAQGSTKLENPLGRISYYGYDNDVLERRPASRRWCRRRRARRPRRRRPSPTRTPTSSSRTGSTGADPRYDYGTHFLFQGHEGGSTRGLHHPHQPRRRRGAPRDAARDEGRRRQPARHDRRLDLGPVGEAPAVHDRERRRADLRGDARLPLDGRATSPARSAAAATRASRTTPPATSGSSRTSAAPSKPGTTREAPEQLRLPLRADDPGRPAHGKLQALQVLNEAGTPITFGDARPRSTAPTRWRCTPTATRSTRAG